MRTPAPNPPATTPTEDTAPPAATVPVRLHAVTRRYAPPRRKGEPRTAVDNVTFNLAPGTAVALLGPNGAGKSTLLRMLATLDTPDEGSVELFGHAMANTTAAAARRRVRAQLGVVFQSLSLDPLLTVRENLLAHAATHGMAGPDADAAVRRCAERFDVADRLNDRVGTLSGGLARRADLARAFLHSPRLVLLDEPTSGLDPNARRRFLDALDAARASAAAHEPVTIVLSTHLLDEAERCDRVIMLHRGHTVADGSPADLRRSLGPAIVRCRPPTPEAHTDVHAMVARTLSVEPEPSATSADTLVVRPPASGFTDEQLGAFAAAAVAGGVAFELAPPTLDDVFAERTGERLASDTADPSQPGGRRKARGGAHA